MTPLQLALNRQSQQRRISRRLITEAKRLWKQIDRSDLSRSWAELVPRMFVLLYAAQLAGAREADEYVTKALEAQGIDPDSMGQINPDSFAGTASDGRPLASLLYQPIIATQVALRDNPMGTSMATGMSSLSTIIQTQVADGFRVAASAAMVTRPASEAYCRMLTPPSCSRCAILAGANDWRVAFKRHPRCDCISVPSSKFREAEQLTTGPKEYFDSLSKQDQDKIFTKAGAEAIRDGADPARVVNSRRGATGLSVAQPSAQRGRLTATKRFGEYAFETTELTGLKGSRGQSINRLMPESLYARAKSKEDAVRLLRVHGYIY